MNTAERRPPLPPLNSLKVFETVARHQSMVVAARELYLTHGAVSRQIKQLESNLGFELFVRRNRGIFLTHAGEQLQLTCAAVFEQLAQTLVEISPKNQQRPLVVSCEPTLAMRWLIARLPEFQAMHPEVVLHLYTAGGAVHFSEQGVDLAIRRLDFDYGDAYCAHLTPERIGPVCTPELWQSTEDILRLPRLHSATRPSAWNDWLVLQDLPTSAHISEHHFEHFYLSIQAASAGLGVAVASSLMVMDELKSGRLIAPLGFIEDGSEYGLLSATPFENDLRKVLFLQWLLGENTKIA